MNNTLVIKYYTKYAKLGIKANSILVLSYLIAKENNIKKEPDGFFYQSIQKIKNETGLTMLEVISARKRLVVLNAITELRRGMPARVYFKVNHDVLSRLLLT